MPWHSFIREHESAIKNCIYCVHVNTLVIYLLNKLMFVEHLLCARLILDAGSKIRNNKNVPALTMFLFLGN